MATVDEAPTKKRKTKELPERLCQLTETNFRSVVKFRLETDPHEKGEANVAYKVAFDDNDENQTFDLDKLTLDQLRRLCKNIGVQYVNKCSKFQCRKAIWVLANHQQQREKDGAPVTTVADRTTNNIIRITNVIFSHNFLDSFLALNDIKTRVDHETGGLPSDFWSDVADAVNGSSEDDGSALQVIIADDDTHRSEILLMDLEDFDIMTSSAIRKKFNMLLKVRKEMKKNMTISGEHDNNAYNFIDVAMKNVGSTGLAKLGCYYFYLRCEENPEVDVRFADRMDDVLMGNTDGPLEQPISATSSGSGNSDKKRAYTAIVDMSNVAITIADEMKETNRLAKETANEMKEKNRLAKQSQLITLAQHLGKHDILEGILASLASSSGD
jgi:hypothetical protein